MGFRKEKPMAHLLPHWNWENKELASKVADAEGKIPVRASFKRCKC